MFSSDWVLIARCSFTDCIVLYRKFSEWPKYKLQGPLEKQDELTNS